MALQHEASSAVPQRARGPRGRRSSTPGRPVRRSTAAVAALAALALGAGACSKAAEPTAATGTSLQGPVVFPSTTESVPGTTAAGTIPDAAKLPTGTAWAGAPDPCALVTETAVRKLTRFNVTSENREAKTPSGGSTKVCLFKNQTADIEGGSVTVTILPPGTDVGRDFSKLSDVQFPPGIGAKAVAGHIKSTPTGGEGTNLIAVDMGDGGFSIAAYVFADIDNQAMLDLATVAAQNWKVAPR